MILQGDAKEQLKTLPAESIQCCVTSPPYWGLRDYGEPGQLGLESTPEEFVVNLVAVMSEVRRVLRKDGTLWLNLGSSYAGGGHGCETEKQKTNQGTINMPDSIVPCGYKRKDMVPIPWLVAIALQQDGWWLRQDIIWHKLNPMPESVVDRCTRSHEYIFLLTKSAKYYYDAKAISETASPDDTIRDRNNTKLNNTPGRSKMGGMVTNQYETRNRRSVWTITAKPYPGAHFATFPPEIPELCIKAGSKEGDTILDPFFGSGTTGWVAQRLMRKWIGVELSAKYINLAEQRFNQCDLFSKQTRASP